MDNERAISLLKEKIDRIAQINKKNNSEYIKWIRDTKILIRKIYGKNSKEEEEFISIVWLEIPNPIDDDEHYKENLFKFYEALDEAEGILQSMIDEIEEFDIEEEPNALRIDESPHEKILLLCNKFHLIVHKLRNRHDDRNTLKVNDEYDVQDLFYALLSIYFQDIRKEEWVPSYAGGSSRVDFLLKNEQIVIETKMTRESLTQRKLGEELIIDIGKYGAHPDCKSLICFVYDPDGRIVNPRGIENDLSKIHDRLDVKVYIRPE